MTKIITVVRDKNFYERFVRNNPFNHGAEFVVCDNTKKNLGIPKHYNKYLDKYNYGDEDWLVFCHEDWEAKEDWLYKLDELDKNSIYGTFGTKLYTKRNFLQKRYIGRIGVSHKDGSDDGYIGYDVITGETVETFDCMVFIIHSSLIKKYNIRFDENLDFHHYTEELCIRLNEEFGIKSRILQMHCKHWSYGVPLPNKDFNNAFNYVRNKYKNTNNIYSNTTVDEVVGSVNVPIKRSLGATGIFYAMSLQTLLDFPIIKFIVTPDRKTWTLNIFKIPIFKKYYQKFRLYLLFIPLLKIRWDDVFGIYLFDILPIIKIKRTK